MQRKNPTDQLVAPTPTVRFATSEAAATITAPIRAQYEQANAYVAQQTTLARQKDEEIDLVQREINERLMRIEQLGAERRQHEEFARQGRDVAVGVADLLAVAGAPVPPVPPLNGELSHDPDGNVARWSAAVDAQNAAESRL